MEWARSQLFWKTLGAYGLLSAVAVIGLIVALNSRLNRQSEATFRADSERRLERFCEEVRAAEPEQAELDAIVNRWLSVGSSAGWRVSLVDARGNSVAGPAPEQMKPTLLRSVIQAADESSPALRWITGEGGGTVLLLAADAGDVVRPAAGAPQSPDQPDGPEAMGDRVFAVMLCDMSVELERRQAFLAVAAQTAVFTWLIGLVCVSLVVMGLARPLRAMTENLANSNRPGERQELLLELSDRGDEFGNVAQSFTQLESDLNERINQLQDAGDESQSAVDLLSAVLNAMVEGVLAIDREERLLFINDAARELLSISEAIGVGHRIYEAVRISAVLDAVNESLRTRQRQTLEFRTSRERRFLAMIINPFPAADRHGAVLVVRDVSELRRLESMRRDFISGVSHELKTPLTAIQACTETLLDGAVNDPDAAPRFLRQIGDQSERLLRLILGMLQLARVESGAEVFRPESVDAADVVDDVLASLEPIAAPAEIRLSRTGCDQLPLLADPQALRTVISNLVENAIRHSLDKGEVTVELAYLADKPLISVRDQGVGIAREHLPRIFERFYRVDRDRSRQRGGTGLGLAIVKHLCQAMHAVITVQSEPGRGSEFQIVFPDRQDTPSPRLPV